MSDNQKAEAAGDSAGELLPCPFCGSPDVVRRDHSCTAGAFWRSRYSVSCDHCNTDMFGWPPIDVDQRWNRRATQIPNANESSEASSVSDKSKAPSIEGWETINYDGVCGDVINKATGEKVFVYLDLRDCNRAVNAHNAAFRASIEEHEKLKEWQEAAADYATTPNGLAIELKELESRLSGLQEDTKRLDHLIKYGKGMSRETIDNRRRSEYSGRGS